MDQRRYIQQRRRKEREELVCGAVGLKRFPLIPLISGGQAFFFGLQDLLLQRFLELPKANTAKYSYSYVLLAPLCCVRSSQQREGQTGQPSEVNTTHPNADNKGSHYNVLAPGLRQR